MNTDIWIGVAAGISTTLQMTAIGFIGGAILGIPLVFMRLSNIQVIRWGTRAFIELVRGIPMLVWLFLVFNGPTQFDPSLGRVFTSFNSAVIVLCVVSGVYMAEVYRGAVRAISKNQWEASDALGLRTVDKLRFVIGPQVGRVAIPSAANYAIGLVKDSSLISTIGVFEITYYATNLYGTLSSPVPFYVAGMYYLMITVPSAWLARTVDVRLRSKVAA